MSGKLCKDCRADISHRPTTTQRCANCATGRRTVKCREYDRARYIRLYAKGVLTCTDCGGGAARDNKNPSREALCQDCSNARYHPKVWTREALIDAVQKFAQLYGRMPGAMDWNVAMARNNGRPDLVERYERDACWPSASSVYGKGKPFASWNDAINAAGFTPRKPGGRGPTSEWRLANHPRRRAS